MVDKRQPSYNLLQIALTVVQSRNGSREFSHVSRRQFLLEQRIVEAHRGCQLDLHQVPQQQPTQPTNQPINALDLHQVPQQHAVIVTEPAHQHPTDSAGSLGWPLPMLN